MSKKADIETTAEAYLELLAARGVEYFFGNAGTDFAPIIEAYARRGAHGQLLPRPIQVPHEGPAVAMAHGYAMVTGRPQAVMVHVIVGTANALGGVINAARGGVPMLFTAGRNPITQAGFRGSRERPIHWAQEALDQGAIVRAFVKRDYELPDLAQLEPVVDHFHTHVNFPQDHPLHAGFDATPYLDTADAIVVVESDAPWFPHVKSPRPETKLVQIGVDPLFSRYPIRGFGADVALAGTVRLTLAALADALRPRVEGRLVDERRRRWQGEHARRREAWAAAARRVQNDRPIDMAWLSRCVGDLVDERTIVVNEYDLDPTQACFRAPGTYFNGPASSSLGWGLGAALGAKLAAPDKTVICTVGDGAYIFGAPTAAHFVARAYEIPVLFVVFNNRAWNAVKRAVHGLAPDGFAVKTGSMVLSDLEPSPDYELVCRASGGHAERVEDPAELPRALRRALSVVREEKRQALLNVICKKP